MFNGCCKKNSRAGAASGFSTYSESVDQAKNDPFIALGNESWIEKRSQQSSYEVRQQEARLIDIPIPIHADSLGLSDYQVTDAEKDSFMLAYRVHLKLPDISNFFEIEMERLGWNLIAFMSDVESMLVFIKPSKVCSISVRKPTASDSNYLVIITCGNNKAGYSNE